MRIDLQKLAVRDNAFNLALKEIGKRLPVYFRRRVSDSAAAEDLAQETLLEALRASGSLRDVTRVEPWTFKIAHDTMVGRQFVDLLLKSESSRLNSRR